MIFIVDESEANAFVEEGLFGAILREERGYFLIVVGGDECGGLVVVEMIFQLRPTLIEVYPKGVEKFSEGEGGINVCDEDDVSSLIEVINDVSGLDAAIDF